MTTENNNLQEIATSTVEWQAIFNDFVNKYEAGRTVKKTAGEALAKGDPFYIKASDGKAWKATNATLCIGVWQSATTAANAEGFGQIGGTMALGSWTANDLIYKNSSGALTATATNNGLPIAIALSATVILIIPQLGLIISQAHIADASTSHAITDPGDAPADADALREDLVTNTIPSIEGALNALGTKVNAVLAALETLQLFKTS